MPVKLTTTVKKIASIPNTINSTLLNEFFQYMKSNSASESHQNNNLKELISFAHFLGSNVS
jgi:flagellar motor switch protein FliG